MGKLINFADYKEEKQYRKEIEELSKECFASLRSNKRKKLKRKRIRPQDKQRRTLRQINKELEWLKHINKELERLRQLNTFNDAFLCLVHIFMEEECPEFGWRFEIFLDKIRNE